TKTWVISEAIEMATIEDNIRSQIKQHEAALFELRKDSVKYLTFNSSGKSAVFDLRYMDEIRAVQGKEKTLTTAIQCSQDALYRAAQLVRGISGTNPENPLTSLSLRGDMLQKEFETLSRDISIYEKRTEAHSATLNSPSTLEWGGRIKEYQKRLKELKPELEKVTKVREQVIVCGI
ncbi:MAG: hypothetical protein V1854_05475, partial [Methanobacteriota archaeon]